VTGAGEIGTGDTVTGFVNVPGESLAIFDRNRTFILNGSAAAGTDAWSLITHSFESGAVEWTAQNMGDAPKFLDDRGITSLTTTQAYGDFKLNALSQMVESYVQTKKSLVNCSVRVREKNQYRLFFSDNTGLIMRDMGGKQGNSFTTIEYPIPVEIAASVEDTDGTERLFFGSDDGYIYEMDKGDSFDGEEIDYRLRIAFNNLESPRNKKRFFKAVVDVDNVEVPDLNFVPDFSYGSPDIPASASFSGDETLAGSGGDYDAYDDWGEFYWDGQYSGQAEAYLDGSGLNMSLLIYGVSDFESVHRLHAISIHYGLRGIKR